MFTSYVKELIRLIPVFRGDSRSAVGTSAKKSDMSEHEQFRFSLDEMRCPICGRRPHMGLTSQLSEKARSEGMMGCEIHGPVKADIVISFGTPAGKASAIWG
jgi:hypothetical protein